MLGFTALGEGGEGLTFTAQQGNETQDSRNMKL
jgi:hypothetical protein